MKKKLSVALTTLLVALFCHFSLQAQPPINAWAPGVVASSPQFPQHTGNSSWGNVLGVSVWDGPTPSFHFDFSVGFVTGTMPLAGGSSIVDPDVVVFPSSVKFCMVYNLGGHIYAEAWYYDAGLATCFLLIPPTMISNGVADCTSPNVDQIENGAAFVWQQNNTIKGRYWDLTVGATLMAPDLGPEKWISHCYATTMNREPDVSIYREGPNDVANIVWINQNSAGDQLILQRFDLDDFYSPILLPLCSEQDVLVNPVSFSQVLSYPRVASPPLGAASYLDCQVVVTLDKFTPFRSRILGVNRFSAGAYSPPIQLNATFANLKPCVNSHPVVSYTGCSGIIAVEWEYNNTASCLPAFGASEVLGMRLDLTGTPVDASYSRVNWFPGTMYRPSVSGRYRNASGLNTYSTYANSLTGDLLVKDSPCFTDMFKQETSVEQSVEEGELQTFPNPFNDRLTISLLQNEAVAQSVSIIDMQGRVLKTWNGITLGTQQLEWDASEVAPGLYMVKQQSDNNVQTQTIVKAN